MRSVFLFSCGSVLLLAGGIEPVVPEKQPRSASNRESVCPSELRVSLAISNRRDGVASELNGLAAELKCVIENTGKSPIVVPKYVDMGGLRYFETNGKPVQIMETGGSDRTADFSVTELTVLKPGERLVLRNRADEIRMAWDPTGRRMRVGLNWLLFPQKLYAAIFVWEIWPEAEIRDGMKISAANERFPDANCSIRLTSNPVVYYVK